MEIRVLDNIAFELDLDALWKRLHLDPASDDAETVRTMAAEASSIARPKALYGQIYIESRDNSSITVDSVDFTSHVLSVNLADAHRVFPYVASCGRELMEWAAGKHDMLENWWADSIMQVILDHAIAEVNHRVTADFSPGKTSSMNPGSLPDWPIGEQRPLFALLGSPFESIGVELTDSCLMIPAKSVSGMRFPTDTSFENCQLCPRKGCPGRSVPYDEPLQRGKYGV